MSSPNLTIFSKEMKMKMSTDHRESSIFNDSYDTDARSSLSISKKSNNNKFFVRSMLDNLIFSYFSRKVLRDLSQKKRIKESSYLLTLQQMHYSQSLAKNAFMENVNVRVRIPKKVKLVSDKPVLVIDLDETLIFSKPGRCKDGTVLYYYSEDGLRKVYFTVYKRPFVNLFLEAVKKHYTLVLFTAAERKYAKKVLSLLDPQKTIFQYRLYKESCLIINGKIGIKDLRMLRGVSLENVFILDNNPVCYTFHLNNAIPITSYFGDNRDRELAKLTKILLYLTKIEHKQEYLRERFFKQDIHKYNQFDELCESIVKKSNSEHCH